MKQLLLAFIQLTATAGETWETGTVVRSLVALSVVLHPEATLGAWTWHSSSDRQLPAVLTWPSAVALTLHALTCASCTLRFQPWSLLCIPKLIILTHPWPLLLEGGCSAVTCWHYSYGIGHVLKKDRLQLLILFKTPVTCPANAAISLRMDVAN